MTAGAGSRPQRLPGIDYIKATAIIAVACAHAGLPPADPRSTIFDLVLCGFWVRFCVPSFLLLSGFLYRRDSGISIANVRARLSRILLPYLVASGLVQATGFSGAESFRDVLFQLLTGSSLGVYYYIFLIVTFIPTIWILSRMTPRMIGICFVTVLCANALVELYFDLFLRPARPAGGGNIFWLIRSPLTYSYVMFLAGWTVAAHLERLRDFFLAHRAGIGAACLLGVAAWIAYHLEGTRWMMGGLLMVAYTWSMALGLVLLANARPAPFLIRFLSQKSLPIYLYHQVFQLLIAPRVVEWPSLLRIGAMVLGGLLGGAIVALAARWALGDRARLAVGA